VEKAKSREGVKEAFDVSRRKGFEKEY